MSLISKSCSECDPSASLTIYIQTTPPHALLRSMRRVTTFRISEFSTIMPMSRHASRTTDGQAITRFAAMKTLHFLCVCASIALAGCEGWPVAITPYNPPTAAASRTPFVRTPTPIIVAPVTLRRRPSWLRFRTLLTPEANTTPTDTPADSTLTPTAPAITNAMKVNILGCDTSFDVLHGMGEVTNAYVTLQNVGTSDIVIVCATLNGLDEGRPHPDKTKCVPSIPAGYQVTLKLTVDTTYKEDSPIQVDVTSAGTLLVRVGEPACTAIGLLLPSVVTLGVLTPVP